MKKAFYIVLFLNLVACADKHEDTYRYSRIISQSKEYPVYLDMSEIGNIQVKTKVAPVAPFKIVFNGKYYFVGDMMKGIHIYEKKTEGISYLCFVECRYLKAFDIINDFLYCNNFVDLVILDVSNPLQAIVKHRQKNHFNQFKSYVEYWNIPYVDNKGYIVTYQQQTLTGTVTEKQQELDFSEYDQLYENLTTKDIPDSWTSDQPENDKPYLGIVKVGNDKIYTWGHYNSWAICTYQAGTFKVTQEDLWASPRGNYAPPYYYSNAHPVKMFDKDGIIYILGTGNYSSSGYFDCIIYHETLPASYHLYHSNYMPIDITYIASRKNFFVLSKQFIRTVLVSDDANFYQVVNYTDHEILPGAATITGTQDKLITLGEKLSIYNPTETGIQFVKEYPGISGSCMIKNADVLVVANQQGLFFYDISDLDNIKLIP